MLIAGARPTLQCGDLARRTGPKMQTETGLSGVCVSNTNTPNSGLESPYLLGLRRARSQRICVQGFASVPSAQTSAVSSLSLGGADNPLHQDCQYQKGWAAPILTDPILGSLWGSMMRLRLHTVAFNISPSKSEQPAG